MRTLVVPVDGSENSINAAHYAADLALTIDADIHLLHIVQIVITPSIVPAGYLIEDMEKAGTTLLDRLSADLEFHRSRSNPLIRHCQIPILSLSEAALESPCTV